MITLSESNLDLLLATHLPHWAEKLGAADRQALMQLSQSVLAVAGACLAGDQVLARAIASRGHPCLLADASLDPAKLVQVIAHDITRPGAPLEDSFSGSRGEALRALTMPEQSARFVRPVAS